MFPIGRNNVSTPTGRPSGTPKRSMVTIAEPDKSITPYFSRLFASPSNRSNNFTCFSPRSPTLNNVGSTQSYRELPPSLFNFHSPLRLPFHSTSQPSPSRPRTATEFLKSATSSIMDRALKKFEFNNRKRPCDSLLDNNDDDDVSLSDRVSVKRYRVHGVNNSGHISPQNVSSSIEAASSRETETLLPRPKLKPTSSMPRPSSSKLPQQVSRLSSATLEAIAFATKRQRSIETLDNDRRERSNLVTQDDNADDLLIAPPAAKRRATRDCETQTVFQVDSSTSTREPSPKISDCLPRRRPPNMTSVSQFFTRLEAKARASSSNLRLAALRRIGSNLPSSSLEDRQAHIRRIFEQFTDKEGSNFDVRRKSLSGSSDIANEESSTVSSVAISNSTSTTSTQQAVSAQPPSPLNSKSQEFMASTSLVSVDPTSVAATAVSAVSSTSTVPSYSFEKTSVSKDPPVSLPKLSFGFEKKLTASTECPSSTGIEINFSLAKSTIEPVTSTTNAATSSSSLFFSSVSSVAALPAEKVAPSIDIPKFGFPIVATTVPSTSSMAILSDNASVPAFSFSSSKPSFIPVSSAAAQPNYSFAAKLTSNSMTSDPGSSFSACTATEEPVSTSKSSIPVFSFPAKSTAGMTATAASTSGFNFSGTLAAKTSTVSAISPFNFQISTSDATSKSESAGAIPAFGFSASSLSSKTTTNSIGSSTQLLSFSTATTTATSIMSTFNPSSFTLRTTTASCCVKIGTTPTFSFSLTPTSTSLTTMKPSTSGFTVPGFNFSATPTGGTESTVSPFSFSVKPSSSSGTTTMSTGFETSAFNFSAAKTTVAISSNKTTMPSFSFSSAPFTTANATSGVFGFSANSPIVTTSIKSFSFSSVAATSSSPFAFGTTTSNASPFKLTTPNSSPFALNKVALANGVASNTNNPFAIQNPAAASASPDKPFGFSVNSSTTNSAITPSTGGFVFPTSSIFQFGASSNTAASTASAFSLNLPLIKSSPSIFGGGEASKRTIESGFSSDNSAPTKIGFGSGAPNSSPFGAPSFAFGALGGNTTGNSEGFNFNAAVGVNNPPRGFNFGANTATPPIFGGVGQASPNPFSAQPTTPNAAASFQQRRRQMRTTRRR